MRRRDAEIAGASAFFALGVMTVLGSVRLGLGTATQPGSGFFAAGIGALMACLSGLTLIGALRRRAGQDAAIAFGNLSGIAALVLAMAGYGVLVERAGFAPTTLIFMLVAQAVAGRGLPGWRQIVTSVAATGGVYLVFQSLLRVGLPAGSWWG